MPPEHARSFGGGASESLVSPFVLVAMVLAAILVLVLPRKYAVVPLLLMAFLAPLTQQIVLGGVHFFVLRIVILAGLARMLFTGLRSGEEVLAGRFNSIDRAFLVCTLCQGFAIVLLFMTPDAVVNQVGFFLDCLGAYFLLRFFIHDEQDLYRVLKCFAVVALIISAEMVVEQIKQVNLFGAILGGVRISPEVREGRIRSQGPFLHELLAGAFGATLVPLFCLLWKNGKAKLASVIGIIGALLITWTSNSSTSLSTLVAGVLAISLWPIRKKMKAVRWGIVIGLIVLQLVMKAPVWFLIAHVDLTGSSSGWHRAAIVDQFIRHFGDWWLIGVKDTGSWGWDMWDAQNQFVSVGETGGLVAFIFFIAMITRCFRSLGNARKAIEGDTEREWFFWLLGAALFSHIVAFFGVNYFDQSRVSWFALLASISATTAVFLKDHAASEAVTAPVLSKVPLAYRKPSPASSRSRSFAVEKQEKVKSRLPVSRSHR